MKKPVIVFGTQGTGLTSLAMALSMLGYRCCSDVSELPMAEYDNLVGVKRRRVFDAYVNVGGLEDVCIEITKAYPSARFIVTVNSEMKFEEAEREVINAGTVGGDAIALHKIFRLVQRLRQYEGNLLILPMDASNKWRLICEFLDCYPPASDYPALPDQSQRRTRASSSKYGVNHFPRSRRLKFDNSPWIAPLSRNWVGVPTDERKVEEITVIGAQSVRERLCRLDEGLWMLRDDTFPSNLALFKPSNVSSRDDCAAILRLQKRRSGVRDYSAAAICSRQSFLYGGFEAVIRPSNVPGVVTGMFFHRNSPRQEIDIELLGKDTTKLLLNVYYNPGDEGSRFEYGYRGTPVLINLGFDASEGFHRYRVEWSPTGIQWFVDGRLIHKRVNWEPTPIPHLPMQFHVNLWPSRSVELAGKLSDSELPTVSAIKSIELEPRIVEEKGSKRNAG
ncbi:MAG: family 16 glycosylhydrolase [Planctomycetes bacterium]|nr:family 16 glycosylhydrolase [Planctomycetota bacterium]